MDFAQKITDVKARIEKYEKIHKELKAGSARINFIELKLNNNGKGPTEFKLDEMKEAFLTIFASAIIESRAELKHLCHEEVCNVEDSN